MVLIMWKPICIDNDNNVFHRTIVGFKDKMNSLQACDFCHSKNSLSNHTQS